VDVSSDPKKMVLPTNFDENLSIRSVEADILSNDLDVEEQTFDDVKSGGRHFWNATKAGPLLIVIGSQSGRLSRLQPQQRSA